MALPSNTVKATWFFRQGGRGWTESLWWKGLSTDLHQHAIVAQNIANKRRVLCGKECVLHAHRVSFETSNTGDPLRGDSLLTYTNFTGGFSTEPAEDSTTALLITFRDSTATKRKQMFMRGIWDKVIDDGGNYIPGYGTWQTKYDDWVVSLQAAVSAVREPGIGWVNRGAVQGDVITGYTQSATGHVTLTLQDPLVFGPGTVATGRQMIRVRALNVRSVLNGQLLIDTVDTTHVVTVKPIAVGPFISPGIAFFYRLFFVTALDVAPQKIVERRTGAPLLEPVGRAKARVRV